MVVSWGVQLFIPIVSVLWPVVARPEKMFRLFDRTPFATGGYNFYSKKVDTTVKNGVWKIALNKTRNWYKCFFMFYKTIIRIATMIIFEFYGQFYHSL